MKSAYKYAVAVVLSFLVGFSGGYLLKPAPVAKATVPVTYVTDFGIAGQDATWFVGINKGFFAQNGIALTVVAGSGSPNTISSVAAGQVQFGRANAQSVVAAIAATPNIGIKIIFQESQLQLAYLAYISGPPFNITKPSDLIGKTVGASVGVYTQMTPAYLRTLGVDPTKVNIIGITGNGNYAALAQGKIAAAANARYGFGDLLAVTRAAGFPDSRVKYFVPPVDIYGNAIIASAAMMQQHPDLVKAFVNASAYSWAYTISHQAEAIKILTTYHPELDANLSTSRLVNDLPIVAPQWTATTGLGFMNQTRMQNTIDITFQYLQLNGTKPATTTMYTDQFFTKVLPPQTFS